MINTPFLFQQDTRVWLNIPNILFQPSVSALTAARLIFSHQLEGEGGVRAVGACVRSVAEGKQQVANRALVVV